MTKLLIIGCSGAGKSTLARELHALSGIEVIHLDQHYLKANWIETPRKEWEVIVKCLIKKKAWIMDGNYGGTMDIRFEAADAIVFLNYPTLTCLWRVLLRTWKNHGRERANMPKGCKERFNIPFLWYVLMFKKTRAPGILKKLESVKNQKPVFIISSDENRATFFKNWPFQKS